MRRRGATTPRSAAGEGAQREREIALLILKGLPSAEIAHVLGGSEKTAVGMLL